MGEPNLTLQDHAMTAAPTPAGRPLLANYLHVRQATDALSAPLAPEDHVVQTAPFVSPTKWHMAHTSWFFETFLLNEHLPGYEPLDPKYAYIFNSYYNAVGPQFSRPHRGMLSRPTVAQVRAYRAHVDANMTELLSLRAGDPEIMRLVTIGLHHEQQHQELLLTDIKHVLAFNPLEPAYRDDLEIPIGEDPGPIEWLAFDAQLAQTGHEGGGFCFDNELPRHPTYVHAFEIASRPVTNADVLAFIADGGYHRPELWLSDGWAQVGAHGWDRPLHWLTEPDAAPDAPPTRHFTLGGARPIDPHAPACHLSYYEADAYATWAGARLPTEHEWELAAATHGVLGAYDNLVESDLLQPSSHPAPEGALRQCFGDVWEWTSSAYSAYPGYRQAPGALGEYNGKFMCNAFVLRGGSCATPRAHIRHTYRNFFSPESRWQFTGLRLARDPS
jgi:ergothioneine biosynthesis protein EgtB